jgi:predicted nucleic acid-binding protein
LAVVTTKYRVYVETTIISDWLLIETSPKNRVNPLSPEVKASHELVSFLLQRKNDEVLPYTSYWAIFESVGVIKRTNIEVWLVNDGIPTSYYHELRNSKKYRLREFQIKKINALIHRFCLERKNNKPFKIFAEQSDIDTGISLILNQNLEAPDSFHMGIALSYGCDFFVTRDHHYKTCKKSFKEKKIKMTIITPWQLIKMLKTEGLISSNLP